MRIFKVHLMTAMLAALMAVSLTACSEWERNAYASLESAQTVYDTGMKVLADLRVKGEITEAEWDHYAVDIGGKVAAAGAVASKAMEEYSEAVDRREADTAEARSLRTEAAEAIKALFGEARFFVDKIETLTGNEFPAALKLLI